MINYYWSEWRVYLLATLALQTEGILKYPLSIDGLVGNYQFQTDTADIVRVLIILNNIGKIKLGKVVLNDGILASTSFQHTRQLTDTKEGLVSFLKEKFENDRREKEVELVSGWVGRELTLDQWLKFAQLAPEYFSTYLRFEIIEANHVQLSEELSRYLEKFKEGDLTTGTYFEPYSYEKQIELFNEAYLRKVPTHGQKQALSLSEIWVREESRGYGKFWELVLAMQEDDYIKLTNLGYSGEYSVKYQAKTGTTYSHSYKQPFIRFEALDKLRQISSAKDLALKEARQTLDRVMDEPKSLKAPTFEGLELEGLKLTNTNTGVSQVWNSFNFQFGVLEKLLLAGQGGIKARALLENVWRITKPVSKDASILKRTIGHSGKILTKIGCQNPGAKSFIVIEKDGEGLEAIYRLAKRNPTVRPTRE